jgi:hypothetical protein
LDKVRGRCNIIDERSYAQLSEFQTNAKGVLFLLMSARASLLRYGADDECLRTIEECVASFRTRYDLTRTYLYGPAVCCKPDVSDGGIGLAHLYPARE